MDHSNLLKCEMSSECNQMDFCYEVYNAFSSSKRVLFYFQESNCIQNDYEFLISKIIKQK
jgi:hypothetical protein